MRVIGSAIRTVERSPIPDPLTRFGIELLVGRSRRLLASRPQNGEADFAREMSGWPIAAHTDAANRQHYELPSDFFRLMLGPRLKYSCCLYPTGSESLAEAETEALEETVAHAGLADDHTILELGCGWGSLTLFMARRFPRARITAVSNSASQRIHIESEAAAAGLANVTVVTADINEFRPAGLFDRVVSVEMFEHMSNWRQLLRRLKSWLSPQGRLFVHVFSHRNTSYRFYHGDDADWIARNFFTGGIMPSHELISHFPDCFEVEASWRWDGNHYSRTALHWLGRFDANRPEMVRIMRDVYGAEAALWLRRWRLFLLATAGLFGHARGSEWGVSHYLLRPV